MELNKTQRKRGIIVSIYVAIILVFVFSIYLIVKPAPSCFDSKRNQNEEGVDCGGSCATRCKIVAEQDIVVQKTGFVDSGLVGSFDIFGQIRNPNQTLGGKKFKVIFSVKDQDGKIMAERRSTNFILPGETKYIFETNLQLAAKPEIVELSIENVDWQETSDQFQIPQLRIVNKEYKEVTGGVGFSEAIGLLKNESPYDFATIRVLVYLEDGFGNIVAVNSTAMNTVKTGENREFKAAWPNRFPGNVSRVGAQAEVNVFDSQAFFEKNFQQYQFQTRN